MIDKISGLDQPFLTFRLRCDTTHRDSSALQRRVEHFDLCECQGLPLTVFSCKTLVVLKLKVLTVNTVFSVDLPSLRILYLKRVSFSARRVLVQVLVGSSNIQNLQVTSLFFLSLDLDGEYTNLHKFPNLTQVKFGKRNYTGYWTDVIEVIKRSPKLQNLVIYQNRLDESLYTTPVVPRCLSFLHLRACCLKNYCGSRWEFVFVKYILQNARLLRDMTISCNVLTVNEVEKHEMLRRLSLCTRVSPTCTISFT